MKTMLFAFAVMAIALVAFAIAKRRLPQNKEAGETPRRKAPLTEREQAMHNRLTQSLPELVVLAQVSFSALLTARKYAVRNTFDRKVADFVVCDKAFQVLAIVELDDSSHKKREQQDASRDTLLTDAGYRVLRYANVPDIERLKTDFAAKGERAAAPELSELRAKR